MDRSELEEILIYEPKTGRFFWKERPPKMFKSEALCKSWNKRYAGKRADRIGNKAGYLRITINDKKYYAHRIAWVIYHGSIPDEKMHIDHINKNKKDNRICNLRCVDASNNHRNVKKQSNNTSGVNGVCWDKRRGKWMSYAKVNQKFKNLGYYDNIEDATAARLKFNMLNRFTIRHGVEE